MRPRLLHLAAALPLTLTLLLALLWLRSYWAMDGIRHSRFGRQSVIWSTRGTLLVETMGRFDTPRWPGLAPGWALLTDRPPSSGLNFLNSAANPQPPFLGFKSARVLTQITTKIGPQSTSGPGEIAAMTIPFWPFFLTSLLPPLIPLRRLLLARQRHRKSQCPICGYDRRHSRHQCPECGNTTPIPPPSP